MVILEADRKPRLPLSASVSGEFGVNIKNIGLTSFRDEICLFTVTG